MRKIRYGSSNKGFQQGSERAAHTTSFLFHGTYWGEILNCVERILENLRGTREDHYLDCPRRSTKKIREEGKRGEFKGLGRDGEESYNILLSST